MKILQFAAILIILSLIFGLPYVLPVDMPKLKAEYYITDQKRETKQFYPKVDWPIVVEWGIETIWVDTNSTIVGVKSKKTCGTMRFQTINFIDKTNFRDCGYVGKKLYSCDHFEWTLRTQLER